MNNFPFTLPMDSTNLPPLGFPSGSALPDAIAIRNRKACIACRTRKVKCDKQSPCSTCAKTFLDCVFPSPVRTVYRPRKGEITGMSRDGPEEALVERVRSLEEAVEVLSRPIDVERKDGGTSTRREGTREVEKTVAVWDQRGENGSRNMRKRRKGIQDHGEDSRGGYGKAEVIETKTAEKEVGKLIIEGRRSRYISNGFWASLDDDVEDLHVIFDADGSDANNCSPSTMETMVTPQEHRGFPFSFSSLDLRLLHPSSSQIQLCWQVYVENVDPLVKILHKPTMEKTILEAKDNLDTLDRGTEALLFAIYFSAVTSMTAEEVEEYFGGAKKAMTTKYRFAVEQALMCAGFLNTQELVTLQAFVLFLVCVRRNDDTKLVWTLTGLAIRIAQSLGLHHDGTTFGLSPFDTEARRRLWWQLCYLDERASEDHGSDSTAMELNFDTKLPLNINDSDLDPEAAEAPEDREGRTDMAFCLIRYEIASTNNLIRTGRPSSGSCRDMSHGQKLADKEIVVKECHRHLETKYLKHCRGAGPVYWLAENVARMVIAKSWLTLHHPLSRLDGATSLSRELKDRLFLTSIQIIERSTQLETDARAKRWRWMIQTYFQWLPVAFVLAELCIRTKCNVVDRAWKAVDDTFNCWSEATANSKNGILLKRLMAKARARKEESLSTQHWNWLTNASTLSTSIPRPGLEAEDGAEDVRNTDAETDAPTVIGLASSNSVQSVSSSSCTISADQQSSLEPWSLDDSALLGDMGVADSTIYWDDWNDLVRDFETGVDHQGLNVWGPTLGGTELGGVEWSSADSGRLKKVQNVRVLLMTQSAPALHLPSSTCSVRLRTLRTYFMV